MLAAGGAEEKTSQPDEVQDRTYDLLYQAVKRIPRAHRLGWYHAWARRVGKPISVLPSQAELDYLAWSERRHQPVRKTA